MKQRHMIRRISESVPPTYEFRGPTKTGEIRHFFLSVAMIPGTEQRSVSLISPIIKKAEEAVRHSEKVPSKDMARLLPETVFETDMNGKITFRK